MAVSTSSIPRTKGIARNSFSTWLPAPHRPDSFRHPRTMLQDRLNQLFRGVEPADQVGGGDGKLQFSCEKRDRLKQLIGPDKNRPVIFYCRSFC